MIGILKKFIVIGIDPYRHQFLFPCLIIKKLEVSFLVLNDKIIIIVIYSTAQWNRIGTVAGPSNAFGIDPYRHQFHFPCWIIKKSR